MCRDTINSTILNILLILFHNVFKTLKWNYKLNLTSSDKASETLFCLKVQSFQTLFPVYLLADISIIVEYCIVIYLLIRPVDQQRRQLTVRFQAEWYCATSEVDVLSRGFRCASNRNIGCESANVTVCYYQELMNNMFFLKYSTINYILNFLYRIFNEKFY